MPLPAEFQFKVPFLRPKDESQTESTFIHIQRGFNDFPIFYPQITRLAAPTAGSWGFGSTFNPVDDLNTIAKSDSSTLLLVEVSLVVIQTVATGTATVGISFDSGTSYTDVLTASLPTGTHPLAGLVTVPYLGVGSYTPKLAVKCSAGNIAVAATDTICVKITEIPSST